MKKSIIFLVSIIVSGIIGFLSRDFFLQISLSQLNQENIQITTGNISSHFISGLIFALSITVIPLLYLIIWKTTRLRFINRGLISCGIIIGCGILFWQFRIFQLNNQFQNLSEPEFGNSTRIHVNFNTLNFEHYLFTGFLAGTVLSILIFKNKRATE